jgi:hypothetical protein
MGVDVTVAAVTDAAGVPAGWPTAWVAELVGGVAVLPQDATLTAAINTSTTGRQRFTSSIERGRSAILESPLSSDVAQHCRDPLPSANNHWRSGHSITLATALYSD